MSDSKSVDAMQVAQRLAGKIAQLEVELAVAQTVIASYEEAASTDKPVENEGK